MPGLSLGMSAGYSTPAAALPPSYANESSGSTISARAYGIADNGASAAGQTAAYGSVGVSVAATVFLVWLWWTLPR